MTFLKKALLLIALLLSMAGCSSLTDPAVPTRNSAADIAESIPSEPDMLTDAPSERKLYGLRMDIGKKGGAPVGYVSEFHPAGMYEGGTKVHVNAGTLPGFYFVQWTSVGGGSFSDENASDTWFIMPANKDDTTVVAHFEANDPSMISAEQEEECLYFFGSGGFSRDMTDWAKEVTKQNQQSGDTIPLTVPPSLPDKESPPTDNEDKTYTLTIETDNGCTAPAGSDRRINGLYQVGDKIGVYVRNMPGYVFDTWISSNGGVFEDEHASGTWFIMPANDVVITAHSMPLTTPQSFPD